MPTSFTFVCMRRVTWLPAAIVAGLCAACSTHADIVGHNSKARRWAEQEREEDAQRNPSPGPAPLRAQPGDPDEVPAPPPPPSAPPAQTQPPSAPR